MNGYYFRVRLTHITSLCRNPQVKVIMLQNNLLQYLSQIWDQELRAASSVNSEFLAQCVLATSSLLRHFPLAQNRFFSPANGEVPVGFHLLNRTMVSPHISRCTSESCSKLKLRIFALLEDLLLEAVSLDSLSAFTVACNKSIFIVLGGGRSHNRGRQAQAV